MLTEREASALWGLLGRVNLWEGMNACGEDAAAYVEQLGAAARRYRRNAEHLAVGAALGEWAAVRLSLAAMSISLENIGAHTLAQEAANLCARCRRYSQEAGAPFARRMHSDDEAVPADDARQDALREAVELFLRELLSLCRVIDKIMA